MEVLETRHPGRFAPGLLSEDRRALSLIRGLCLRKAGESSFLRQCLDA